MLLQRTRDQLRDEGPLLVACVALVAFGVFLRFRDIAFPNALTWDEHHFVINARNYIHHAHDWNDHPPLGKLLISLGMLTLGDVTVGWRIVPAILGATSIGLSYAIGARVFQRAEAGWMAAAFAAADGFLISYSRTALLDGMLTTFVLLVVLCALLARTPVHFLGVGLVIGAAMAIKMSAVALVLPVLLLCLRRPRPVLSIASLGSALLAFLALWSLGLHLAGEPSAPLDAWKRATSQLASQAGANQFTHPLTSRWYTWGLPRRPVTIRFDLIGPGIVRASTTLGNLLLWWTATVAFFSALAVSATTALRMLRARSLSIELDGTTRAVVFLFSFGLAMLLPWTLGLRDSYIYHYLPTYSLLLVLLAGVAAHVYRTRRLPVLGFVLSVGLVSAFYAPVWAQLPLTTRAFEQRLFLPMWR